MINKIITNNIKAFDFEIKKAELTVSYARNHVYDGERYVPQIIFGNFADPSLIRYEVVFAQTAGINVGAYTFTINLTGADASSFELPQDSYFFTVSPATLLISSNVDYEYNSQAWSSDVNDLTIEGLATDEVANGVISSLVTNVGLYTRPEFFDISNIGVTRDGISTLSNYDVVVSITLSISYPRIPYTVVDGIMQEDGSWLVEYTYNLTQYYAKVESDVAGVSIKYSDGRRTVSQPFNSFNACDMEITFTLNAKDYKETTGKIHFVVNKAQLVLNEPDLTKYFDGYAVEYNEIATTNLENSKVFITPKVEYHYYYEDTDEIGSAIIAVSRVAKYIAYVTIEETENYYGISQTLRFEIKKTEAPIFISESYLEQEYTGSCVEDPVVTTYSKFAEKSFKYYLYDENAENHLGEMLTSKPYDIGRYVVEIFVKGNEQYGDNTKYFEFSIVAHVVDVFFGNNIFAYDGQPHLPEAWFFDVDGHKVTLNVSIISGDSNAIMAGDYELAVAYDSLYYALNKTEYSMIINKRSIEVSYMNDYIEYNGNAFCITLTESNVLGLASTDTLSITLETISSDVGKYQENKRYGESFEKFIISNISIMNNELSVVDSYKIYITMNVEIHYTKIDYNFNDSVNNDGLFTITTDFAYNSELEYIPYSPSLEYITEGCIIEYLVDGTWTTEAPIYINADTYRFMYRVSGENHETVVKEANLIINRVNYQYNLSALDKQYDGTGISPTLEVTNFASVRGERFYTAFKYYADRQLTTPIVNPSEVGTYYLRVIISSGVNYNLVDDTHEYTISKAENVFKFNAELLFKDYDGTNFEINFESISAGSISNLKYWNRIFYNQNGTMVNAGSFFGESELIINYYKNGVLVPNIYEAGEYQVQFALPASNNFEGYTSDMYDIVIRKAQIVVGKEYTNLYPYDSKTFDNQAYTWDLSDLRELNMVNGKYVAATSSLSFSGNAVSNNVLQGLYNDSSDFTLLNDYHVYDFINGVKTDVTANYEIVLMLTLNIERATANIQASGYSGVYDGNAHGITISVDSNITGSYTIYYSNSTSGYSSNEVKYTNAGEYTVYYKIVFENYATAYGSEVVSISKATPTISVSDITREYNGFMIGNPVVTTNSDGNISYTYYQAEELLAKAPTNKGNYTVVISLAETNNYEALTTSVSFEIQTKKLTLVWNSNQLFYTGLSQAPSAYIVGATYDNLNLTITAVDAANNQIQSIEVGSYNGLAYVDNDNYEITNAEISFDIVKRIVDIPDSVEVEFTGYEIATFISSYYQTDISSVIDVNRYNITLTLVDKDNYIWSNGKTTDQVVEFIVTPASLLADDIVVGEVKDQTYTTNAVEPSVNISYKEIELVEGVDYELTYSNNVNAYVSGANMAVIHVKGINNFKDNFDIEFKIISMVFTLNSDCDAKFYAREDNYTYTEIDNHTTYDPSLRVVISNFKSGKTISEFLTMFDENQIDNIEIWKGTKLIHKSEYDTNYIATGMQLVLRDFEHNVLDVVYVSILGDVNGDGFISVNDAVLINSYLKGQTGLINEFYLAADIDKDGFVSSSDYMKLYYHVLGYSNIESGLK